MENKVMREGEENMLGTLRGEADNRSVITRKPQNPAEGNLFEAIAATRRPLATKNHRVFQTIISLVSTVAVVLSISTAWVVSDPDAAYAAKRPAFSIFVGRDRRLKTIDPGTTPLPPGDTYLSDGVVSVSLISPVNYKLRKLRENDYYYLDRGFIVSNLPANALDNRVWIVGNDGDMLNTTPSFIQFEISDTARVYILYDSNAISLPSWMTGFALDAFTVSSSDPAVPALKVYLKIYTKGTVRLGGNEGSTTGAQCNYVVVVRRPVAGDLGTPEQIATTQLLVPRLGHRMVALNNGRVLIVGGLDTDGVLVAKAELYDSTPQSFIATGSLIEGRNNPAVVKLNDGRVLVIGGDMANRPVWSQDGDAVYEMVALSTCEIYDPSTQFWTSTGSMGWRRRVPEAIKLADGRVFVSGGADDTSGWAIKTTEVFDPSTNTWTAGPDMTSPSQNVNFIGTRYGHRMSLLPDGRVLIAGGLWHGPEMASDGAYTACEIYDPVLNTMTQAAPMTAPRGRFGMVDMGAGKFMAMGGLWQQRLAPFYTTSRFLATADVEIYDAATNTWSTVAPMPRGMYDFATASPDPNRALVFDGYDVAGTDAGDILLYDGIFNTWTLVGSLVTSRSFPLSSGADMVTDVGDKDFFRCGGAHFDEVSGLTTLLQTGERFKY